jgi:hypothetical protein
MFKQFALTVSVLLGTVSTIHAQSSVPSAGPSRPLPVGAIANSSSDNSQPGKVATELGNSLPASGPINGTDCIPEPNLAEEHAPCQWWTYGEFLFGWVRSSGVPPLLTTSPAGTPQATAGVLGSSTTTVLFGGQGFGEDLREGFRLGGGAWLNESRTLGFDVGFFMVGGDHNDFSIASSTGTPIIARPFTDASTSLPTSDLIAFPGVSTGTAAVALRSNEFWGADVDFQEVITESDGFRWMGMLGYRFLRFNDGVEVDTFQLSPGSSLVPAGTQTVTSDRFTAENTFHGVDFGTSIALCGPHWSVDLLGKIAVGNVNRSVGIEGLTTVTMPGGAPTPSAGGILALSSNSGVHTSHDWVIVPEAGLTFSWQITDNIVLRTGYSFLYWSDVARASNQISTTVNSQLFPPANAGATPLSPTFTLQKSDIWLQTLNVGLEFRF